MLSSENSALPGSSAGDSVAPVRLPLSLSDSHELRCFVGSPLACSSSLWDIVLFDLYCLALYRLLATS